MVPTSFWGWLKPPGHLMFVCFCFHLLTFATLFPLSFWNPETARCCASLGLGSRRIVIMRSSQNSSPSRRWVKVGLGEGADGTGASRYHPTWANSGRVQCWSPSPLHLPHEAWPLFRLVAHRTHTWGCHQPPKWFSDTSGISCTFPCFSYKTLGGFKNSGLWIEPRAQPPSAAIRRSCRLPPAALPWPGFTGNV